MGLNSTYNYRGDLSPRAQPYTALCSVWFGCVACIVVYVVTVVLQLCHEKFGSPKMVTPEHIF